MVTMTFHLLDHIVDDIKDHVSISMLSAGLYEHKHIQFKSLYSKTSKRQDEAMNVTVKIIEDQFSISQVGANS